VDSEYLKNNNLCATQSMGDFLVTASAFISFTFVHQEVGSILDSLVLATVKVLIIVPFVCPNFITVTMIFRSLAHNHHATDLPHEQLHQLTIYAVNVDKTSLLSPNKTKAGPGPGRYHAYM
jgi:hypothetical protein